MSRAAYHSYLCSRPWRLKRDEVFRRADGVCERCRGARADQVHHFTYERLGNEDLDDLAALCEDCHAFLSAKSNHDPIYTAFPELPFSASQLFIECSSYHELVELWRFIEYEAKTTGLSVETLYHYRRG